MTSRWKRALLVRGRALALFCAAAAAAALALEAAARLAVKVPPPLRQREGLYVSGLPLINAHPSCRWTPTVRGEPLPARPAPGELRVFVFGESSVQGSPWGYPGSPATMLRDRLAEMMPGRAATVVNMGRSCASMMDSYYFLLDAARYRPGVVVFYQGSNDRFDADRERCMPQSHPLLHAAWRFLAARSRALWAARALGPRAFRSWENSAPSGPVPPGAPRCDAGEAFSRWTRILIRTARSSGAKVIVTSPVRNPLLPAEMRAWTPEKAPVASALAAAGPSYREALRCELAPSCAPADPGPSAGRAEIESRAEAWKASAAAEGAAFVDVRPELGATGRNFVGETHLTLDGYWLLATRWAEAIAGRSSGPAGSAAARYESDLREAGTPAELTLYSEGLSYLRARMALLAAPSLRRAAAAGVSDAQLVLAALRSKAGLPPRAPPALKGWARFDLDGHLSRPASEPRAASPVPPPALREALAAFSRGDWAAAEAAAGGVLAHEPSNPTALLIRGSVYRQTGRLPAAVKDFTAVVDSAPEGRVLADALANRSQALDALGRAAEAEADRNRASRLRH